MKKKYTDAQSYFQDWAQIKKKEVQNMEESMRGNPLYQKEVNPMDDDETWSKRFHFILHKGLPEKEWKAYQKGIRQDRLQIWAMFMNENPDYDYHYFLNLLKFKLEWMIFYWENFGHLARAEQDISRMRIATRLLDIIMETLSKILCKWKQDSVVSLFLYLNSVFKHKHKLIHNQAPV